MILWKHKRFTAFPYMVAMAVLSRSLIGAIIFGVLAATFYIRK